MAFKYYKMQLVAALLFTIGSCYPIMDETTAKSNGLRVLPQAVEHTNNFTLGNRDEQQSRANEFPLSGVQHFFSRMNFLNGSNPFSQLFSSYNNPLNDVHVFLVANQGLIFPATTFFKGFDIPKGIGNILQNIPKLPSIGSETNKG